MGSLLNVDLESVGLEEGRQGQEAVLGMLHFYQDPSALGVAGP